MLEYRNHKNVRYIFIRHFLLCFHAPFLRKSATGERVCSSNKQSCSGPSDCAIFVIKTTVLWGSRHCGDKFGKKERNRDFCLAVDSFHEMTHTVMTFVNDSNIHAEAHTWRRGDDAIDKRHQKE
jgi:hypothetical protein